MFNAFLIMNNGESPKGLPELELDGKILNYKQNTKFLGVYIHTTKLNWRLHIKNVITKARKGLFLKYKNVSTQPWCQDILLHLSISLPPRWPCG